MKRVPAYILLMLLPLALLTACGGEEPVITDDGYTDIPYDGGEGGIQPMTGIAFWSDNTDVPYDLCQLEFIYLRYSDFCSQQGIFNWAPLDALLNEIAIRGHQAILRFYYTYPGQESAVPDYIKARPDYEETVATVEGERTCFPDWRCTELKRFHQLFYTSFALQFDNDPRIAFLETGFGLWAEYHIDEGPYIVGQTFPDLAFQTDWIMTTMGLYFEMTPWCISIDAAQYGPFEQVPFLMDYNFGNFDDSFMCEEHDLYNAKDWAFFGTDRYKRAPLGGEFSYYTDYDQQHCLDKEGIHGRTFESEARRYHLSFIIGNDQLDYQPTYRIEEAAKAIGYRFKLCRFAVKEGESARMVIKNIGTAPVYQDAFPAVDGVVSTFNLRALMPGDSATVTIATPTASAASVPSVKCERLLPSQHIDLVSR